MRAVADLVAPLREHLERNTSPDLAVAFQLKPHFCRKFFTLEKLIDLLQKEAPILSGSNLFELLRDEVVRRLLIVGDRARWRSTFLNLLRSDGISDPILGCFAERYFEARNIDDFAASEGRYLRALQEAYEADSPLRGPIYDALAWLAALPEQSTGNRFRVLFSSESHHRLFPEIFASGICVSFSFTRANSTEPFARYDVDRIGNNFRRAAEEAEIKAYEVCGKTFGAAKHRRVRIEDNLEDLSVLDGTSGYLSFLMVHLCLMKGITVSPYVGFTGSFKDFQRLDTVADLPQKMEAAINAGMRVLFVPRGNYASISKAQQDVDALLRVEPYDEHMSIDRVAEHLADRLLSLQAELTPIVSATTIVEDKSESPVSVPVDHSHEEPAPLAEPRRLFRAAKLSCFIECGGHDGLQSPAKMSVFNSEDDCFVAIFPGKKRVYRFDSFGALCDKFRSDARPLCIAWNEDRSEYVIGFDDNRIRHFNSRLEPVGTFPSPEQVEPRLLTCGGGYVYVCDLSERIVRIDSDGNVECQVDLDGKICHLAYSDARQSLIVSMTGSIVGLDLALRTVWKLDHFAPQSVVAAASSGDLWVALSSGHLWRVNADNQKIVDVIVPPHIQTVASLDQAVALGTLQGEMLLFDMLGQKVGGDDLKTTLYHVSSTEGDILVLSTASGPTVVKPQAELFLRTRERGARERAMETLLEWERSAQSGGSLHRLLKEHLRRLDLTHWQEVYALQSQFLQRRALQPALYEKIETALRFIDSRKAARVCEKTKPVIIDGSNVSRHHWGNNQKKKRRARLAAILRLREKLASDVNPVLYPMIIVVDVTERHHTDDLASLKRMIEDGEILETPSSREADALIFNLVKSNNWLDCCIVSNDRRMFDAHAEMLPNADRDWYDRVRMAFTINPRTNEVYFPERSIR